MWKNIFLESCVLSLLVFGGFYINANFMKERISDSGEKVRIESSKAQSAIHISGNIHTYNHEEKKVKKHISGNLSEPQPPAEGARPLGVSTR